MSVQKFVTTEKLVEYLDQEAGSLLLSKGIYDIGNYGWKSEDTEDPEYIGHALWQISHLWKPSGTICLVMTR